MSARGPLLIVEDDADNAAVLLHHLRRRGHTVSHVLTGEAALQHCAHDLPDAVLLDLRLPGMGGDEVLRRLRGDARTGGLPVLVLSVLGAEDVGRLEGADAYLKKPYQIPHLYRAIDAALGRRAAATPPEEP